MTAPRHVAALAREALLWLAALAGLACVVLAVLGHVAGFGVVLFRTGSMAPAIPAGSAALVRTVPASALHVGDVVTVDRPGTLPVTHRVVAIEAPDGAPRADERQLTLRGDANDVPDPSPYRVDEVRRVLWSVPGVAPAIAAAGRPTTLVPVTLAATALVVWALWPRRRHGPGAHGPAPRHPGFAPTRRRATAERRSRTRRRTRAVVAGAVATVLAVGALVAADAAGVQALELPSPDGAVIDGRHLQLVSVGDPERMATLSPGDAADWVVGVLPFQEGTVVTRALQVSRGADDLVVEVESCAARWTARGCARPRRLLDPTTPAAEGAAFALGEQQPGADRWLRIRVRLEEGAHQGTDRAGVGFSFIATGRGESLTTGVPGGSAGSVATDPGATADRPAGLLASTGARVGTLLGIALALVLAGALAKRRATGSRVGATP